MPTRVTGLSVSVFTLGGSSFITALTDVTVHIDAKSEDASGIADQFEYAWAVKNKWHMDVDTFVESSAALMLLQGSSVTVSWISGATTYTGTALVKMTSHNAKDGALQKVKGTLEGQGTLVLS